MPIIIPRAVQQLMIAEAAKAGAASARQELAQRDIAAATGGGMGDQTLNGAYNESGTFEPYIRCDVDGMNSGRGCAP